MLKIVLPSTYAELLRESPLETAVKQTARNCTDFYADETRSLPFFPEYTAHGVEHVQQVLDSTEWLLTADSPGSITPEDAAVLTLAVLLHDAAMHLTEDSFLATVRHNRESPRLPDVDTHNWSKTWELYLAEATRWSDQQLRRVLGDSSQAISGSREDLARYVRPLEEMGDPETWPLKYRKFVGEFIRRHHGRMAHEFAVDGVPCAVPQERFPLLALTGEMADLVGIVARSHVMKVRDTFPYLRVHFHGRGTCFGCHPVYLMVLLRIADYLHLTSDRAPASSLRLRSIRSPISRAEWLLHRTIQDVREDDDDKEAVLVVAKPTDAETYLNVRRLLDDLQSELDISWAVLGEVYSRQDRQMRFGLRLRRVKSNLDDLAEFRKTIPYVPSRFAFDTEGAVLLKKLVMPLYGDHSEIGVRELLQNAIDATNERRHLHCRRPCGSEGFREDESFVHVRLERSREGGGWITVEDRGIGMDENVLGNYFFRVGATFRESDAWRSTFEAAGVPAVLRSGRFGIGVLAAFLLGEHIDVVTRHVYAEPNAALQFSVSIDDDVVELRRCFRASPGTTIRVKLDAATYDRLAKGGGLEWDWYRWTTPAVIRSIDGCEDLPQLTRVPEVNADLPTEWHRLAVDSYDDLLWTFGQAPNLVCNGINIGTSASSRGYSVRLNWDRKPNRHDPTIPVQVPSVSIADRQGVFPVNLQRSSIISHKYPFAEQLLADVVRDFVAYCLVFAPDSVEAVTSRPRQYQAFTYPGYERPVLHSFLSPSHWFFTREGSGVLHWDALSAVEVESAVLLISLAYWRPFPRTPLADGQAMFIGYVDVESWGRSRLAMAICHAFGRSVHMLGPHVAFFTENDDVTLIGASDLLAPFRDYWDGQTDLRGFHCSSFSVPGDNKPTQREISVWKKIPPDARSSHCLNNEVLQAIADGWLLCVELTKPRVKAREHSFAKIWRNLITEQIIPFDRDIRRARFSHLYAELAEFVEKWEALREQGPTEVLKCFQRRYMNDVNTPL
jgi:molecular chaperone HtpG